MTSDSKIRLTLLLAASALALGGCGGGGSGGSGGGTTVTPTPTPTVTPTPSPPTGSTTPAPTPTPTPTPAPAASTGQDNYAGAASFYVSPPSAQNCVAGQLTPAVSAQALNQVNALRALHRLPPVGYSAADEPAAQASSLMMAANNQLNHTPPTSWACYTSLGASGAGSGNLYGGNQTDNLPLRSDDAILAGWMDEVDNIVADNVGHRRWILNPFATTFAYGRVVVRQTGNRLVDMSTLKVFNNAGAAPSPAAALPPFVAYPFGDYPARYVDTRSLLSFGVIVSATNRAANAQVDYSGAAIRVADPAGTALAISRQSSDTQGYGLPNNLQWAAAGLQPNVIYTVTISNVRVQGAPQTYSYTFRIVP